MRRVTSFSLLLIFLTSDFIGRQLDSLINLFIKEAATSRVMWSLGNATGHLWGNESEKADVLVLL